MFPALPGKDHESNIMKTTGYLVFLFLILNFQTAKSTTWITIGNGSWSDGSIWFSGIVPSYSITDTILIKDTITFDENIYLNTGALMQIDSIGGALCGHHDITVYPEARLNKYGALSLDTLFIKGGIGDFILPGPFLMWLTRITDGGSFHLYSYTQNCLCSWDTCFIPIPVVIPSENPVIINSYTIFPNPSSGNFNLQYTQANESTLYFYNMLGQVIFVTDLQGISGNIYFNKSNLNNGLYYWEVRSGDKIYENGKYLISK